LYIPRDWKAKFFRKYFSTSHLHLRLKGGHAVSTLIAQEGVDLSDPKIVLKQDACRIFNFVQFENAENPNRKHP